MDESENTILKAPAFQFYPADFVAGTQGLSAAEAGAYVYLMCDCWTERGIPNDLEYIRRVSKLSEREFKKLWPRLSKKFQLSDDGTTYHQPRLERERIKQAEHRKKREDSGRKGGEAKSRNQADRLRIEALEESDVLSDPVAKLKQTPSNATANGVAESSSSSSSSYSVTNVTRDVPLDFGRKGPSVGDLAAYRILDSAWPLVCSQHEMVMPEKQWRGANKKAALALAEAGKTPGEIENALEMAYESKYYNGITMLSKLQEHWPKMMALGEFDEAEFRRKSMNGDYLPVVGLE